MTDGEYDYGESAGRETGIGIERERARLGKGKQIIGGEENLFFLSLFFLFLEKRKSLFVREGERKKKTCFFLLSKETHREKRGGEKDGKGASERDR